MPAPEVQPISTLEGMKKLLTVLMCIGVTVSQASVWHSADYGLKVEYYDYFERFLSVDDGLNAMCGLFNESSLEVVVLMAYRKPFQPNEALLSAFRSRWELGLKEKHPNGTIVSTKEIEYKGVEMVEIAIHELNEKNNRPQIFVSRFGFWNRIELNLEFNTFIFDQDNPADYTLSPETKRVLGNLEIQQHASRNPEEPGS